MVHIESMSCWKRWQSEKMDLAQISQGRNNCWFLLSYKPVLAFPRALWPARSKSCSAWFPFPLVGKGKENQILPMATVLWWSQADLRLKNMTLTAQVDIRGVFLLPGGGQMGTFAHNVRCILEVSSFDEILLKVGPEGLNTCSHEWLKSCLRCMRWWTPQAAGMGKGPSRIGERKEMSPCFSLFQWIQGDGFMFAEWPCEHGLLEGQALQDSQQQWIHNNAAAGEGWLC